MLFLVLIEIDFFGLHLWTERKLHEKSKKLKFKIFLCIFWVNAFKKLRFYSSGFESKYVFRLDSSRHESKFPFSIKIKWKRIEIRYFLHFDSSTVEENRNVKMHFRLHSTLPWSKYKFRLKLLRLLSNHPFCDPSNRVFWGWSLFQKLFSNIPIETMNFGFGSTTLPFCFRFSYILGLFLHFLGGPVPPLYTGFTACVCQCINLS